METANSIRVMKAFDEAFTVLREETESVAALLGFAQSVRGPQPIGEVAESDRYGRMVGAVARLINRQRSGVSTRRSVSSGASAGECHVERHPTRP